MERQPFDLSDFNDLKIYDLAEEWATETGKPIMVHLRQMAVAIDEGTLSLADRENWQLIDRYETRVKYGTPGSDRLRYSQSRPVRRWKEPIYKPWRATDSPCISFLKKPLSSPSEKKGLKAALNKEGITICRDDFRAWLEAEGHPLPRFWFASEANHPDRAETAPPAQIATKITGTEASNNFRSRQKRHSTQSEKRAAKEAVSKAIQSKVVSGESYHPRAELRHYMEKNGIPKEKETGLANYIKNKCDYIWPSGPTPKL